MAEFHSVAPRLMGERVVLRPYCASDLDRLAHFYQTSRASMVGGMQDRAKVWRDLCYDAGQWPLLGLGTWAVEERQTGEFVGQAGLNLPVDYPEVELGWIVFEGHEGKGYAFDASALALDFAFSRLNMKTLVSYIDPANARSIRLAERLGGVLDPGAATPGGDACLVYRHNRK